MKLGRKTVRLAAILVVLAALGSVAAVAEESGGAEAEAATAGADAATDAAGANADDDASAATDEAVTAANAGADATTSSSSSKAADDKEKEHRPEEDWGYYYDPKNEFCGEFDCYSILGFDYESFGRSPPDTKTITQAYRLLSRKWHPDKQRGKSKDFAEERFVRINKAHKVLTNKRRRKEYDYLRDRPEEYIHKYGTNVMYHYAPKSDVVMVLLILLIACNVFTWFAQKNRWQKVADHVVQLALEGATLRDGGSDESVAIREKALEILAEQKQKEATNNAATAAAADDDGGKGKKGSAATRRGSSGSAKSPSPTPGLLKRIGGRRWQITLCSWH